MALPLFLGVVVVGTAGSAAAAAAVHGYTPVTPVRICDTRAVSPAVLANPCQGAMGVAGTLGPAGVKNLVVAGSNGVPMTATAVVLNVTATNVTAVSFFTVWPTGIAKPVVSNLNWIDSQIRQNLVTVPLGTGGAVSFYNNQGMADLVVDLQGFVDLPPAAPGLFTPVTPQRICDTRPVGPGVAANQCQGGTLTPGGLAVVNVAGLAGVPAAGATSPATAVVLNVTVVGPSAVGFLTVWPDGTNRPLASNLNWGPGQTLPNRVIVPLSAGGKIDIYNSQGRTDVIVDVNGYFSPTGGAGFRPYTPLRVCDTRPPGPGVALNGCNSNPANSGPLLQGDEISLPTQPDSTGIVYNVTVVNTTGDSFLTLFPDPNPAVFTPPPLISDLNWPPRTIAVNLAVVGGGANHAVAIYNNIGTTDLVIDVQADWTNTLVASAGAALHATVVRHRHR